LQIVFANSLRSRLGLGSICPIHVSFHGRKSFRRRCERASECVGQEFYLLVFARDADCGMARGANIRRVSGSRGKLQARAMPPK
jgi:hypothetical protein